MNSPSRDSSVKRLQSLPSKGPLSLEQVRFKLVLGQDGLYHAKSRKCPTRGDGELTTIKAVRALKNMCPNCAKMQQVPLANRLGAYPASVTSIIKLRDWLLSYFDASPADSALKLYKQTFRLNGLRPDRYRSWSNYSSFAGSNYPLALVETLGWCDQIDDLIAAKQAELRNALGGLADMTLRKKFGPGGRFMLSALVVETPEHRKLAAQARKAYKAYLEADERYLAIPGPLLEVSQLHYPEAQALVDLYKHEGGKVVLAPLPIVEYLAHFNLLQDWAPYGDSTDKEIETALALYQPGRTGAYGRFEQALKAARDLEKE